MYTHGKKYLTHGEKQRRQQLLSKRSTHKRSSFMSHTDLEAFENMDRVEKLLDSIEFTLSDVRIALIRSLRNKDPEAFEKVNTVLQFLENTQHTVSTLEEEL